MIPNEAEVISQIPFFELAIPVWQMALYIVIISVCTLSQRHRLALIVTYLFTLYWGFFSYFGQIIATLGTWPNVATLFVMCGLLHVGLTVIAFFQEETHVMPQTAAAP